MKTVNLQTQERVKLLLFPDNQPHVTILNVKEGDEVKVVARIRSSLELVQLLEISNALDHLFAKKKVLVIPYLMGARSDRLMQIGDSVDLEVVADLINLMGFEKVILFDVHSQNSLNLIQDSENISSKSLVSQYNLDDAVLICPDTGAARKVGTYLSWNKNFKEVVYCDKVRDLRDGKITLKVLTPEKCAGRNCVIIDDICCGAGTFLAIRGQIQPKHLTLIITHAIFSKGVKIVEDKFDEIIISNSYGFNPGSPKIKVISWETMLAEYE